jgi:hypothetical protein
MLCCETCLIIASMTASLPPPNLMPLFPEMATGEWKFHVADSIPVPVNGSDLETQW